MKTDRVSKPFTIGLSPLGERPWLIVDARLPAYLAEKAALRAAHPDRVFRAETGTEDAQREALDRVLDWQLTHHPERLSRNGNLVGIEGVSQPIRLDDPAPALHTAASLCAEDLVLMRKGATGWRLAAADLCFPSSWSLAEKFARPIDQVHQPVPGFSAGTRNDALINRIFDNLGVEETVLRGNWSIYGDDTLHHPAAHASPAPPGNREQRIDPGHVFLREERQTITRLKVSGDLLFTILITLSPLRDLAARVDGREQAADILEQLQHMTPDQLAYKGLTARKPALCALLDEIVRGSV